MIPPRGSTPFKFESHQFYLSLGVQHTQSNFQHRRPNLEIAQDLISHWMLVDRPSLFNQYWFHSCCFPTEIAPRCKFYWFKELTNICSLSCRQELVIFRLLVAIMLGRTWHLSWMLHALSILLIGFQSNFFGKLWSTLMKQQDSIEGSSFVLEWNVCI